MQAKWLVTDLEQHIEQPPAHYRLARGHAKGGSLAHDLLGEEVAETVRALLLSHKGVECSPFWRLSVLPTMLHLIARVAWGHSFLARKSSSAPGGGATEPPYLVQVLPD